MSDQPRIVYKALKEGGISPYQKWKWPLPMEDAPGEWVEVDGPPALCRNGLHGYLKRDAAHREAEFVFEMEVAGETVEDDHKLAATRARLLRRVEAYKPIRVKRGLEPCLKCGKPHDYFQLGPDPRGFHSWGDPIDGHAYHRADSAELAERILGLAESSTTGMVSATAILEVMGRA
jgi:hypothetical protein